VLLSASVPARRIKLSHRINNELLYFISAFVPGSRFLDSATNTEALTLCATYGNMQKKRTALIFLAILIPAIFYFGFTCNDELRDWDNIGRPVISSVGLISYTLEDSVYLISKRWGLTGDHQIYALSLRKPDKNGWHPNYETDCIWEGYPTIFYQKVNDIITIYATDLPRKMPDFYFEHDIKIKLIEPSERQKFEAKVDSSFNRLR
jgi:hypothetical protein